MQEGAMDLDQLQINPRVRSAWEAIDLGFVMTRAWWKPLFLVWFIPAAAIYIPLCVLNIQSAWIAVTVVWWVKPLLDRGPLYIASRKLIGEPITLKSVLKALPRLYLKDLVQSLTIRRLSPTRSFDLPITVLEGLQGSKRLSRLGSLHYRYGSAAGWLTIVGYHVELIILLGLLAFIWIMLPGAAEQLFSAFNSSSDFQLQLLYNTMIFCAMVLVGPFYALAGFALYISRRIELEAWDIEIQFRHLARRTASSKASNPLSLSLPIVLLSIAATFMPADTQAEGHENIEYSYREVQAVKSGMIDTLSGEDFHQTKKVSGWRLINLKEDSANEQIPEWLIRLIEYYIEALDNLEGIEAFASGLAKYIKYLIVLLALALLLWFGLRYRREIKQLVTRREDRTQKKVTPDVLFGLAVSSESLPENIPDTASSLWHSGKHREAVALLYRGLLAKLMNEYDYVFSDSHTEGECAAIVRRGDSPAISAYTGQLTRCWQALAYGHKLPHKTTVESLCEQWHEIFNNE